MYDVLYFLLKEFDSHDVLSVSTLSQLTNSDPANVAEYLSELLKCGYIRFCDSESKCLTPRSNLRITVNGRSALRDEKHRRKYHHFSEFRSWATLAIALSALVLSLINMFTS